MGSPSTYPNDGISKAESLPEGTNINPKDLGSLTQLADRGQPEALVTDHSGAGTKYHVHKTQSTRFEVSDPDHNKGMTYSKVKPDTEALLLTIVVDIQSLLEDFKDEVKDASDDDVLKNTRRSYVQEEIIKVNNVQNDAGNTQRFLQTTSSGSAANVQCYNCSEKGYYVRNYLKQKVRDSKYFMEQMLLAKQDEGGVTLIDEQNDFLIADAFLMEEIKELSGNICLMARI
nr:hypothetical protein [Tanacetum cinerariifolium]